MDHKRITMLMVPSSQGYGAISSNSPGFDEQAFFDDIIDQPLVAAAAPGEKPAVKQRKSWESAMSSNKTQRFVSALSILESPIHILQIYVFVRATS